MKGFLIHENIIVGFSFSMKIPEIAFDDSSFALSEVGGSAQTGLTAVRGIIIKIRFFVTNLLQGSHKALPLVNVGISFCLYTFLGVFNFTNNLSYFLKLPLLMKQLTYMDFNVKYDFPKQLDYYALICLARIARLAQKQNPF